MLGGYATRMFPLTEKKSKALLPVGGRPLLDYLFDELEPVEEMKEVILVTNAVFYPDFKEWAKTYKGSKKIVVLDDTTLTNDTRLGAIGDTTFAIETEKVDDDILLMPGDNYFSGGAIKAFVEFSKKMGTDCIMADTCNDMVYMKQFGVISADENKKVIDFEEKPEEPKSNMRASAFYYYKKETLPLFRQYLDAGNNKDQPGRFFAWLSKQKPCYVYQIADQFVDIGTIEAYNALNEKLANKK
jgi:glucose-1-phosphate thymidylyltransferase